MENSNNDTSERSPGKRRWHRLFPHPLEVLVVCVIVVLLNVDFVNNPFPAGIKKQKEAASAAKAHNLMIALLNYSHDHKTIYPSGKTSTDVFQQLYDQKYLTNASDVYLPGSGKVPYSGSYPIKLQAANVSWDIIQHADGSGLNSSDPEDLPVVISCEIGAYTFRDGKNSVTIARPELAIWGGDGITMAKLEGTALFSYSKNREIDLTDFNFKTNGHVYITIQP